MRKRYLEVTKPRTSPEHRDDKCIQPSLHLFAAHHIIIFGGRGHEKSACKPTIVLSPTEYSTKLRSVSSLIWCSSGCDFFSISPVNTCSEATRISSPSNFASVSDKGTFRRRKPVPSSGPSSRLNLSWTFRACNRKDLFQ